MISNKLACVSKFSNLTWADDVIINGKYVNRNVVSFLKVWDLREGLWLCSGVGGGLPIRTI